jgi:hypothetical protein
MPNAALEPAGTVTEIAWDAHEFVIELVMPCFNVKGPITETFQPSLKDTDQGIGSRTFSVQRSSRF